MIRFQEKSEEDLKQIQQQAIEENPLIQDILRTLKEKEAQIQKLQEQIQKKK